MEEISSSNEKAILRDLGLSTFSRAKALSILLEILNVKIMIQFSLDWKELLTNKYKEL